MENIFKPQVSGVAFAQKTIRMLLVTVVVQVIAIVASVITTRSLGPTGKGIFTVINLYPVLLLTIISLGIYRAVTIHVAEGKHEFSCFPASILSYGALASVISIPLFFIAYAFLPQLFIGQVQTWLIFLALLMTPLLFVNSAFSSLLEVKNKISFLNIKDIFSSVVLLVSLVVALIILRAGVVGAVSAYFVANLLTAGLLIYFVRKISADVWRLDFSLLGKLIRDGAKLQIPVLANFIYLRIDALMLGQYKLSSSVGFYSVAVSIAEMLFLVSLAIQTAFYSSAPDMIKDKQEMTRKTLAVYRNSLVLFVLGALVISLASGFIIELFFGKEFLPAVKPLLILLPGSVLLYSHNILGNYLVVSKRFLTFSLICSFSAGLNVVLNMFLIPRYDFNGAALTSTITYSVTALLLLVEFLRTSGLSLKEFIVELKLKPQDFLVYRSLLQKLIFKKGA